MCYTLYLLVLLKETIPNTIIIVSVGIAPIIITVILHILVVHYSLSIVTSVTFLLGLFSTTLKLHKQHTRIISDLHIKNIVMTKDNA